jgi:hypothetical protein
LPFRSLLLSLLLVGSVAAAEPTPQPSAAPRASPAGNAVAQSTGRTRTYSRYEEETIARALRRSGGRIDQSPAGKIIEAIDVVTFDVIEDRDPAPQFLNWFHVTTREEIVRREILLAQGQSFTQRLSDETERNLRDLFLFSVVIALPLQGSAPDRVRYLVITKDIWSLRAGWDGRFANGVIDLLSVHPTETNLLGTSRQVFATVELDPWNYTLGLGLLEPRLAGTRLRVGASLAMTISCQTGEVRGYAGDFSYTRPLFSTRTEWSYATTLAFTDGTARLVGSRGAAICSARDSDETILALDENGERTAFVPNEYEYDTQAFTQSFTRSFGWLQKTNLSFGLRARRIGRTPADLSSVRLGPSPSGDSSLSASELRRATAWYTNRIRPNSVLASPFFQVSSFTTNFHRDINAESLGLQEDFRLGPIATLMVYPALRGVVSNRSLLGVNALASYALEVGTGYFKLEASHNVELSRPEATDASVTLGARFTSPRLAWGRFVSDAYFTNAYRNYSRLFYSLDNTSRLRGYRARPEISNDLFGTGVIAHNLEFRSRPLQIFSTLLGVALFHDIGDAFYDLSEIRLKQSAGFGIRFLAPQLDREVLRLDFGFPLPPRSEEAEFTINAAFGQAFTVP